MWQQWPSPTFWVWLVCAWVGQGHALIDILTRHTRSITRRVLEAGGTGLAPEPSKIGKFMKQKAQINSDNTRGLTTTKQTRTVASEGVKLEIYETNKRKFRWTILAPGVVVGVSPPPPTPGDTVNGKSLEQFCVISKENRSRLIPGTVHITHPTPHTYSRALRRWR